MQDAWKKGGNELAVKKRRKHKKGTVQMREEVAQLLNCFRIHIPQGCKTVAGGGFEERENDHRTGTKLNRILKGS